MAEERIQRKELWVKLANLKKGLQWIRAAETLGLSVTQPNGGSSHFALRLPGYEKTDVRGCVTNVFPSVRKDVNEKVFKSLLDAGFEEDEIWKALGMLK